MGRLTRNRSSIWPRRLSAAIFVVALFVRLMPLGLYVTPDEPIWVLRSLRLLEALRAGDLTAIPQTGHPGITTMALGAFGAWLTELAFPAKAAVHLDWIFHIADLAPENSAAFRHLVYFLPAGRISVAIATSVGLALAYAIGRRRLGEKTARLLALFLALDPFFSGYAGLLHTDALQAIFVLLAVLLVIPPGLHLKSKLRGFPYQLFSLTGAALFLALAGLTKMLGLLAAPGLAVAVLVLWTGPWWQRVVRVVLLTAMTLVFLMVLYPPAWIDAPSAVRSLVAAVTYHEGIGLRPVFFAGQADTNPGPWFYPVVLLFRLTPPVLLGLAALAVSVGRGLGAGRAFLVHMRDSRSATVAWVGLLPTISYFGALTFAGKKFDRYVLTVVPLLTIVAALSWRRVQRKWRMGLLALLLLPWAWVAVVPLQYADPLFGGPSVAQYVVPLGWGEASGLAAHKLNDLLPSPEVPSLTLMTENVPGTAAIFAGKTWPWADERVGCTDLLIAPYAPEGYELLDDIWAAGRWQAEVYMRSSAPIPRLPIIAPGPLPGLPSDAAPPVTDTTHLQAWLEGRIETGDAFVWLHAPQCYPLTEAQIQAVLAAALADGSLVCEPEVSMLGFQSEMCTKTSPMPPALPYIGRFAGAVDLISAAWPDQVQAPDPLVVRLRWEPQTRLGELTAYLALRDETGQDDIIWTEGGRRALNDWDWPAQAWPVEEITDAESYASIPLSLPPGTYRLVLGLAGADGWLGYTRSNGAFGGTELALGEVKVLPAPYPAPGLDLTAPSGVTWPGLRVIAYEPPAEQLQAGRTIDFALGLERQDGAVPAALNWELVCAGRRGDGGILSWPTDDPATWPVGYRYVVRFAPRVSPSLPAASCAAYVWPVDDGALSRLSLGDVSIEQRLHSFELPRMPEWASTVTVDDLAQLIGADISANDVRPGAALTVTLYWRVLGEATADYTVFVHAVSSDGQVWGQSDAWPDGGMAPTMTWVAGEIIVDAHSFELGGATPAGTYDLYVGLYDAGSGVRVPLYERGTRIPDDRARVGTFAVRP